MPVRVRQYTRRRKPSLMPLSKGKGVFHYTVGDQLYHVFTESWTGKKWADVTEVERDLAALEMLDRFARHKRMEFKDAVDLYERTDVGKLRQRHGLDTDSGSTYFRLRRQGKSDKMAQYIVYKERGLI